MSKVTSFYRDILTVQAFTDDRTVWNIYTDGVWKNAVELGLITSDYEITEKGYHEASKTAAYRKIEGLRKIGWEIVPGMLRSNLTSGLWMFHIDRNGNERRVRVKEAGRVYEAIRRGKSWSVSDEHFRTLDQLIVQDPQHAYALEFVCSNCRERISTERYSFLGKEPVHGGRCGCGYNNWVYALTWDEKEVEERKNQPDRPFLCVYCEEEHIRWTKNYHRAQSRYEDYVCDDDCDVCGRNNSLEWCPEKEEKPVAVETINGLPQLFQKKHGDKVYTMLSCSDGRVHIANGAKDYTYIVNDDSYLHEMIKHLVKAGSIEKQCFAISREVFFEEESDVYYEINLNDVVCWVNEPEGRVRLDEWDADVLLGFLQSFLANGIQGVWVDRHFTVERRVDDRIQEYGQTEAIYVTQTTASDSLANYVPQIVCGKPNVPYYALVSLLERTARVIGPEAFQFAFGDYNVLCQRTFLENEWVVMVPDQCGVPWMGIVGSAVNEAISEIVRDLEEAKKI